MAGMDLHLAMATSSLSFLFTGISGTLTYAWRGSVSWRMAGWLCLGIVPAAMFGAWVNVHLGSRLLTILLALLIVLSGAQSLKVRSERSSQVFMIKPWILVLIGVSVGFGSALTGTGGPVLLLPILIILKMPSLVAVGVSQVVQLPIAVFASLGFAMFGEINLELGLVLGTTQAIAVLLGAYTAHRLSSDRLRQIISLALITAGTLIIFRTLLSI
jgi:uncharacterized membrane protein YfcA